MRRQDFALKMMLVGRCLCWCFGNRLLNPAMIGLLFFGVGGDVGIHLGVLCLSGCCLWRRNLFGD
jgi:hypothetical protein